MKSFFYIIAVIATISGITAVLYSRWYARKTYEEINRVLERILRREEHILEAGDVWESKLVHKANRVVEMLKSDAMQAQKEMNAIQTYLSDMAHQMKTPLSGIAMNAELLIEVESNKERNNLVFRILGSTSKLQWLMNGLIKMSRLEVGAIQLLPRDQSVNPTIEAAAAQVSTAARAKGISINIMKLAETPLYHDRRWTQEAMENVLENAVKYATPNSVIEIDCTPLSLYTRISVTNTGSWLERNEWNKIFKRFYRGKNSEKKEGAGLGLYLSSVIMQKQGGYITVDSVFGNSITFSFFLQNCKKSKGALKEL